MANDFSSDDSFVSVYDFSENNLGLDSQGNFDLTLSNVGWQAVTNDGSGAAVFDGTSYATLRNVDMTNIHPLSSKYRGNEFSFSCWIYVDREPTDYEQMLIFQKGDMNKNNKCFMMTYGYPEIWENYRDHKFSFYFGHNNGLFRIEYDIPHFPAQTWYHIEFSLSSKYYYHSTFSNTAYNFGRIIIRNDSGTKLFDKERNFTGYFFENSLSDFTIGGLINDSPPDWYGADIVKLISFEGKIEKLCIANRYLFFDEHLKIFNKTYNGRIINKNDFTNNSNVLLYFSMDTLNADIGINSKINLSNKYLTMIVDNFGVNSGNAFYVQRITTTTPEDYIDNIPTNFPFTSGNSYKRLCIYFWARLLYINYSIVAISNLTTEKPYVGFSTIVHPYGMYLIVGANTTYSIEYRNEPLPAIYDTGWFFYTIDINDTDKSINFKIYDENRTITRNVSGSYTHNITPNTGNILNFGDKTYFSTGSYLNELIFTNSPFSDDDIIRVMNGTYS
jgi:hypothetical protein